MADLRRLHPAPCSTLAFQAESRGGPSAPAATPAVPVERDRFLEVGPGSSKPLSPLRKIIARRMLENWNTIPHVTQFDEADITRLDGVAEEVRAGLRGEGRAADAHVVSR